MSFSLRKWVLEPEYRVVRTIYLCKRLETHNPLLRALTRLLWRWYVVGSGCLISPHANIGAGLHLPHPTGIVVGETVRIGDNVALYQNVTIGRRLAGKPGEPVIGDDVTVYAGAVLIGNIQIGHGATIGANSVVQTDVPEGGLAVGNPARIVVRPSSSS